MKLAKRALVVVMAVAMIACMSAMAFAAGSINVSTEVEDDVVTMYLNLANGVGATSGDLVIKYDASVLEFDYNEDGVDAEKVGNTKSNSFSSEINDEGGSIKYAFYFKTSLVSHDDFLADAKKGKDTDINSDNFGLAILYFNIKNPDTFKGSTITVDVTKGGFAGASATVGGTADEEPATDAPKTDAPKTDAPKTDAPKTDAPKTDAPKTDAPKTDAPKTDAPKTDAPKTDAPKTDAPKTDAPKTDAPKTDAAKTDAAKTDAAKTDAAKTDAAKTTKAPAATQKNPNTGDVPTGDNMALAAAFGVVALAGAAFVISKKRK